MTARLAGSVHGVVVQIGTATSTPSGSVDAERRRQRLRLRARHRRRRPPATLVRVFDLCLGQRRAAIEAPVHRLDAAAEVAALDDLRQRAQHVGLVAEIHGAIRAVPVADHAEPLEVAALDVDLLGGVFAALRAECRGVELVADLAVLLLDRVLDRQAVAVPARHVGRVEAGQQLRLDHHVLEDLVDRVADVDRAVGVRRAVVQHERRAALRVLADLRIQVLASQRASVSGSRLGRSPRIGKSVAGRWMVAL